MESNKLPRILLTITSCIQILQENERYNAGDKTVCEKGRDRQINLGKYKDFDLLTKTQAKKDRGRQKGDNRKGRARGGAVKSRGGKRMRDGETEKETDRERKKDKETDREESERDTDR